MPEQMESTIDVPALVSQLEVISQEILVNERLNIEDRKNAAMIVHTLILICRNRADLIRKSSVFYMTVRCTTDYFDLTESVAIHMENYCLHRTRGNPPTDKQKEEMLLRSLPLCFVQAYNTIKFSDDERSIETFISKLESGECIDGRTRSALDFAQKVHEPELLDEIIKDIGIEIAHARGISCIWAVFLEILVEHWGKKYLIHNGEIHTFDDRCLPYLAKKLLEIFHHEIDETPAPWLNRYLCRAQEKIIHFIGFLNNVAELIDDQSGLGLREQLVFLSQRETAIAQIDRLVTELGKQPAAWTEEDEHNALEIIPVFLSLTKLAALHVEDIGNHHQVLLDKNDKMFESTRSDDVSKKNAEEEHGRSLRLLDNNVARRVEKVFGSKTAIGDILLRKYTCKAASEYTTDIQDICVWLLKYGVDYLFKSSGNRDSSQVGLSKNLFETITDRQFKLQLMSNSIRQPAREFSYTGKVDLSALEEYPALIYAKDYRGQTLLLYACMDNPTVIGKLLACGANPNEATHDTGDAFAYMLAEETHIGLDKDVLREMIRRTYFYNVLYDSCQRPIHRAAECNDLAMVEVLYETDPNIVSYKDWVGNLPMASAWLAGRGEIVDYMRTIRAPVQASCYFPRVGRISTELTVIGKGLCLESIAYIFDSLDSKNGYNHPLKEVVKSLSSDQRSALKWFASGCDNRLIAKKFDRTEAEIETVRLGINEILSINEKQRDPLPTLRLSFDILQKVKAEEEYQKLKIAVIDYLLASPEQRAMIEAIASGQSDAEIAQTCLSVTASIEETSLLREKIHKALQIDDTNLGTLLTIIKAIPTEIENHMISIMTSGLPLEDLQLEMGLSCDEFKRALSDLFSKLQLDILNKVDKWQRNAFHLAAKKGDLVVMKYLIKKYSGEHLPLIFSRTDIDGKSALYLACEHCHDDIINLLLKNQHVMQGIKDKDDDRFETTVLMTAVRNQKISEETLKKLIECSINEGYPLTTVDSDGRGVIHHAAMSGSPDSVEVLLNKQSQLIDSTDHRGNSALLLALKHRRSDIALVLLSNNASIETKVNPSAQAGLFTTVCNDHGLTVLTTAIEININSCVLEKILSRIADDHLRKSLLCGLRKVIHIAANSRNFNAINALIAREPSLVFETDHNGANALLLACSQGDLKTIQLLLNNNSPISVIRNIKIGKAILKNANSLMVAVTAGIRLPAIIEGLIERCKKDNIALDSKASCGLQVIHMMAAKKGNCESIKIILEHDPALLNAVDDRNRNALSWACHCRDEETIRFLLNRRCSITRCQHFNFQNKFIEDNVNPLMLAVQYREISSDIIGLLVERLRDEKVSLTDETGYGRQAIHFAAQGGNCAAIKKLLQSDPALIHATSNYSTSGWNKKVNMSPFHVACDFEQEEAAMFLIKSGAILAGNPVVSLANMRGLDKVAQYCTLILGTAEALMKAIDIVDIEKMKTLITKCPEILDQPISNDYRPLEDACRMGNLDIVKELVNNGAKIDQVNMTHQVTPLMLACLGGHCEIIDFLLTNDADVKIVLSTNPITNREITAIHGAISSGILNKKWAMKLGYADLAPIQKKFVLLRSAGSGLLSAISYFLETDPDLINAVDSSGQDALLFACSRQREDVVNFLLDKGATVTSKTINIPGALNYTVLMWALHPLKDLIDKQATQREQHLTDETLNRLIKRYCSDSEDKSEALRVATDVGGAGKKIIHLAAEIGHIRALESLLESDPTLINEPDNSNQTPLVWACKYNRYETVFFLLQKGADPTPMQNDLSFENINDSQIKRKLSLVTGIYRYIDTRKREFDIRFVVGSRSACKVAAANYLIQVIYGHENLPVVEGSEHFEAFNNGRLKEFYNQCVRLVSVERRIGESLTAGSSI